MDTLFQLIAYLFVLVVFLDLGIGSYCVWLTIRSALPFPRHDRAAYAVGLTIACVFALTAWPYIALRARHRS